jgi:hypothetical protein
MASFVKNCFLLNDLKLLGRFLSRAFAQDLQGKKKYLEKSRRRNIITTALKNSLN